MNPSLLLFEQKVTTLERTKENDYKVQSCQLLLERVRQLMTQASDIMLGRVDGKEKVWDMEDVRLAKSEMIAKTRTA